MGSDVIEDSGLQNTQAIDTGRNHRAAGCACLCSSFSCLYVVGHRLNSITSRKNSSGECRIQASLMSYFAPKADTLVLLADPTAIAVAIAAVVVTTIVAIGAIRG